MAKVLGAKPANKVLSGSDWKSDLKSELELSNNEEINSQMIPLDAVVLDEKNAREICISIDEIRRAPKINNQDDLGEDFEASIRDFFLGVNNSVKKIDSYLGLVSLAQSIGSPECLIQPITVCMNGSQFQLVSGHRRTLAHHILGAKFISAIILPGSPDRIERSIIQWKENFDREDLSLFEKVKFIKNFMDDFEVTRKKKAAAQDLMLYLSLKKTMAHAYKKVVEVIENNEAFERSIKLGIISSIKEAYKMASLPQESIKFYTDHLLGGDAEISKENANNLINPKQRKVKNATIDVKVDSNNYLVMTEILKTLLKVQEVSEMISFSESLLTNQHSVQAAWQEVFEQFARKCKQENKGDA